MFYYHCRGRSLCLFGLIFVLIAVCICSVSSPDVLPTAAQEDFVSLPIIMYHSLLNTESTRYIVSPAQFESDLKYLTTNGYTTVTMSDLFAYVNGEAPLPEKPIMLTFDDGYYNNYFYAYPLLEKYDCKMVLSPIGRCSDQFSENDGGHITYSHVTWHQLREMSESGRVEIANHTYNLHTQSQTRKGIQKNRQESTDAYRALLWDDIGGMQQKFLSCLGQMPLTFTYPFGAYSNDTLPILKELGFKATLTCEAFTNRITKNPDCLYELGRYLRPHGVPSDKYFTSIIGST